MTSAPESQPGSLRALSHDLRNPVTSLQLLLELAEATPDGSLRFDRDLAGMLQTALSELTLVADQIQQLARATLPNGRSHSRRIEG